MKGMVAQVGDRWIMSIFLSPKDVAYLASSNHNRLLIAREGTALMVRASASDPPPTWRGAFSDYLVRAGLDTLDVPAPATPFKLLRDHTRASWDGAPALIAELPPEISLTPRRGARFKLHPLEVLRVRRLAAEGVEVQELMSRYGVSDDVIRRALRGLRTDVPGLTPLPDLRCRPHSESRRARMAAGHAISRQRRPPSDRFATMQRAAAVLLCQGLSHRQIAAQLGVSQPYVTKIVASLRTEKHLGGGLD